MRKSQDELDSRKPAFYCPDFFLLEKKQWIQFDQFLEMTNDEFLHILQALPALPQNLNDNSFKWTLDRPEKFKMLFADLQMKLQEEKLQKAVPYIFTLASEKMTEGRLASCLRSGLKTLNTHPGHLYGFWDDSSGVLGVTPELLFSHDDLFPTVIHTMALAGTIKSSSSENYHSFLNDEKMNIEHQKVVEGISHSLQHLGTINVGSKQLMSLPNLTHMLTPIDLELNQPFDFEILVRCLHPTPALGTWPKEEGKIWLKHYNEHFPRSYYGAPIGFHWLEKKISQCYVAIRNVQWDHSGMRIGAGCGIVKESLFENEWKEIQLKIGAIKSLLGFKL